MTRCGIADRFLPCISEGNKISENYFSGIYFIDKFGYLLGKGMLGRIKVDDRILPAEPLEWKNEEVVSAPKGIVKSILAENFNDYESPVYVRKKDIISLLPDKLTHKRKSKSTVILKFTGKNIHGEVVRKGEVILEKNFYKINIPKKRDESYVFEGQIKFNLFNFEKFVLEIVKEYDIIGIQLSKTDVSKILFSCHRLDKKKPMIDCILWEGGEKNAGMV